MGKGQGVSFDNTRGIVLGEGGCGTTGVASTMLVYQLIDGRRAARPSSGVANVFSRLFAHANHQAESVA
jgi:hypothetical protein